MGRYMKKGLKFITTLLIFVLMSSQLCFAAEKTDMSEKMPERIVVEGGVLELVNVPATTSQQGIMRAMYRVKTAGGNLNVRSGPGTNYSVIGQFANGQLIDVATVTIGIPDGWDYVYGDDCNTGKAIEGCVAAQYIDYSSN